MKTTTTPEARRLAMEQAIANTRIEGHVPSEAFLADVEAFVAGDLTTEQMIERALVRAHRAARPEPGHSIDPVTIDNAIVDNDEGSRHDGRLGDRSGQPAASI